tara:strand:+ start:5872 stop:6951 length:1080 start_codon:yes stop_codon:yes gene_type:complete
MSKGSWTCRLLSPWSSKIKPKAAELQHLSTVTPNTSLATSVREEKITENAQAKLELLKNIGNNEHSIFDWISSNKDLSNVTKREYYSLDKNGVILPQDLSGYFIFSINDNIIKINPPNNQQITIPKKYFTSNIECTDQNLPKLQYSSHSNTNGGVYSIKENVIKLIFPGIGFENTDQVEDQKTIAEFGFAPPITCQQHSTNYTYITMPKCEPLIPANPDHKNIPLRDFPGIAKALHCCERNNILHGDLQPGNIMRYNGNVVLIDFGLSVKIDLIKQDSFRQNRDLHEFRKLLYKEVCLPNTILKNEDTKDKIYHSISTMFTNDEKNKLTDLLFQLFQDSPPSWDDIIKHSAMNILESKD